MNWIYPALMLGSTTMQPVLLPTRPPAMLLRVILFAYSQGIVSSRRIESVYREHVTFIALSGDTMPHFTTIAAFVSSLADDIARVFTQILYLCDRQGLIGREMFAIDGVKLPSNASKQKSGTRTDFEHQAVKLKAAARVMLEHAPRTEKVDAQWKLFCLVHNIEKLAHHGYAQ
jgi:hypothetical protein